ncbi:DEAD/DEAH box helicase family protein [Clostridium felsineum]|uniref:DEAD/DEAH box helicase family protein n=1 Tax=Clostridium felsineum TaxID=36839 RepID=UPI00098CC457|nr:DEAD/DEAH box helicase family protein [Clostridium felsineum]URZ15081.1 UvrABC system protein B [Clostridium felsineum DSM 794]
MNTKATIKQDLPYKEKEIELLNCITGDMNHLLPQLKASIKKAKSIDIIVAFLMESGVKLLVGDLKEALEKGVPVRILTGNYLNITQPHALYRLKDELSDKVDLRFYNIRNKSFHPKAYIFEYEKDGDIFIGSSNISKSALTSGIEWNYRIKKSEHENDFKEYKQTFEDLFLNHSIIVDDNELKRYSKAWRKPKLFYHMDKSEDLQDEKVVELYSPKPAQVEALYALKKSREEGFDRGIVIAATGIGKTFLAAFDSKKFKKILFVAHRQEIIEQAQSAFKCVRPEDKVGFFTGKSKDEKCDILFATVQTLGRLEYCNEEYFKKDYFDYIVIDEFHHAVTKCYQNIINYFTPKFLLGITATPERMDNKDVFDICKHNVVYEVRLKEAINKGWLVPFRYYGIFDETDYGKIAVQKGKYIEKDLEEALMVEKRADLILKHYEKYTSKRALGFCSSRKHANYMAGYFSKKGVEAYAVLSGEKMQYSMNRVEALEKFKQGKIKVIFSVDMFNEGLDVPEIDMVMFLRPTESETVFLQQLGRGLRGHGDKKYLNVLDFIGNYKKANLVPYVLSGEDIRNYDKAKKSRLLDEEEYPDGCTVDFDFRIVDIFKKIEEKQKKLLDLVRDEFYRVKEELERVPTRYEMYKYIDNYVYNIIRNNSKVNIFNDYLSFLNNINEINDKEKELVGTNAHDFIKKLENTAMSKTYKMPLLLAFYNNGDFKLSVSEEDIYLSFKDFYSKAYNAVDLVRDKGTQGYLNWDKKEYLKIAKNPRKAFVNTASEFFMDMGESYNIKDNLKKFQQNKEFIKHFKDVIDYKTIKFYKERLEKKQKEIYEHEKA